MGHRPYVSRQRLEFQVSINTSVSLLQKKIEAINFFRMSKNEKQTKITAFFARDRPAKKKSKVCQAQIEPIEAPEIEMTAIEKNHEGDM